MITLCWLSNPALTIGASILLCSMGYLAWQRQRHPTDPDRQEGVLIVLLLVGIFNLSLFVISLFVRLHGCP